MRVWNSKRVALVRSSLSKWILKEMLLKRSVGQVFQDWRLRIPCPTKRLRDTRGRKLLLFFRLLRWRCFNGEVIAQ